MHDDDLLLVAERLISDLQSHSDQAVRQKVETLLATIDTVHRTGLTKLVAAIQGMAGDSFIHRLCSDPAVRLLLMSYDLVAVDRRIQTEEAVDAVRSHLHTHGIDVEIKDVVGSVVYAKLHTQPGATPNLDGAKRDLEAALKEGLLGFQQLVLEERTQSNSGLIQLGVSRTRQPVYATVGTVAAVMAERITAVEAGGQPILLIAVGEDIYAVQNRCGDSPLPLQYSTLDGTALKCSWHGCQYDVRTGDHLLQSGEGIRVFPVRVENGSVQIAITTEPSPTT